MREGKGANRIDLQFLVHGRRVSIPKFVANALEKVLIKRNSGDPEFRTDCVDAVLGWIHSQSIIVGCQYWFTHPDVIAALLGKPCELVIQYHPWMDMKSERRTDGQVRNYLIAKYLYPALNQNLLLDVDPSAVPTRGSTPESLFETPFCQLRDKGLGVGVFRHTPLPGEFENIMHHKYLIGINKKGEHSVLHGSFNLSLNAERNLESVLIFRDNKPLWTHLYNEFLDVCSSGNVLNWEDFALTPGFLSNDVDYQNVLLPTVLMSKIREIAGCSGQDNRQGKPAPC